MDGSIKCPVWLQSLAQKWPHSWTKQKYCTNLPRPEYIPARKSHQHLLVFTDILSPEGNLVWRQAFHPHALFLGSNIYPQTHWHAPSMKTSLKTLGVYKQENVDTFPPGESSIVSRTCLRITCPLSPLTSSHCLPSPINFHNKHMLISSCFKWQWCRTPNQKKKQSLRHLPICYSLLNTFFSERYSPQISALLKLLNLLL